MTNTIISKLPPLQLSKRRNLSEAGLDDQTVFTTNGRAAIVLGLRTLDMPKGAQVLMPEWHCGSEVDAVITAGGEPVLYQLESDCSANLDDIAAKIKATKPWGLYCTHYFGYSQPLEELSRLATENGLVLIEDLALGLLSQGGTSRIGEVGDMTVYSLVKTLPVTDGGALRVRNSTVKETLASQGLKVNLRGVRNLIRRASKKKGPLKDKFAGIDEAVLDQWDPAAGIKEGPLFGASALSKMLLKNIPFEDIRRNNRVNYRKLWNGLSDVPGMRPLLPALPQTACPAFFPLYVENPDSATAALSRAGIESVRFWRRFHPRFGPESSAHLAALRRHVLRLPIHSAVDDEAIERTVQALTARNAP